MCYLFISLKLFNFTVNVLMSYNVNFRKSIEFIAFDVKTLLILDKYSIILRVNY